MPHRWLLSLALVGTIGANELPDAAVAGQGGFGTIKGRLVWKGNDLPRQKVLIPKGQSHKDVTVCAAEEPLLDRSLVVDPRTRGVRYGVVYLARPNGENPGAVKDLAEKPAVVRVKNCEFLPYVSAIHQDQLVRFTSEDPVNHNAHLSPLDQPAVNQVLAPFGSFETRLRAERGVIPLVCDIHGWTRGWVMVFDHPFFAVTGEDGLFEITGVPAGNQPLAVWQETMKPGSPRSVVGREVQVRAGRVTDVGEIALDEER